MKLVRFPARDGRQFWVNPKLVAWVSPYWPDSAGAGAKNKKQQAPCTTLMVPGLSDHIIVAMPPEDVVRALAGD